MKLVRSLFFLIVFAGVIYGLWYLISPLFIEIEVNDQLPIAISGDDIAEIDLSGLSSDEYDDMSFDEAMEKTSTTVVEIRDIMPIEGRNKEPVVDSEKGIVNNLTDTKKNDSNGDATASFDENSGELSSLKEGIVSNESSNSVEPVVEENKEEKQKLGIVASSPLVEHGNHPVKGKALIVKTAAGYILRYEDFSTVNGPNLHIYLATDLSGKDYIDLGPIKGTKGNINYVIPDGVDLSKYRYALHRCVPFRVLFNSAEFSIE